MRTPLNENEESANFEQYKIVDKHHNSKFIEP